MYKGDLVFATNNRHKLEEVKHILGADFQLFSLADISCNEELPETHDTLEENAYEKAEYVFSKYKSDCFAEDTGLEVEALDGAPGVFSARYAGEDKDAGKNIQRLLKELEGCDNRRASFRAVISLIIRGKHHQFEGIVKGEILKEMSGKDGFGYDPVFKPNGYNCSFAEMNLSEKSKISHRKRATEKLREFLHQC